MSKVIYTQGEYRIIEVTDECSSIEDLSGDCFDPAVNPDVSPTLLVKEQRAFVSLVSSVGVFGYVLEKWNSEINQGWECVDSCFGFVGPYDTDNQHYIIDEYINTIEGK